MATATLTSKGQITIPAAVREELRVDTGDRLEFIKCGEGRYEVIAASHDVKELKGMVKTRRKVSVEAMNAAISQRMKKR